MTTRTGQSTSSSCARPGTRQRRARVSQPPRPPLARRVRWRGAYPPQRVSAVVGRSRGRAQPWRCKPASSSASARRSLVSQQTGPLDAGGTPSAGTATAAAANATAAATAAPSTRPRHLLCSAPSPPHLRRRLPPCSAALTHPPPPPPRPPPRGQSPPRAARACTRATSRRRRARREPARGRTPYARSPRRAARASGLCCAPRVARRVGRGWSPKSARVPCALSRFDAQ